MQKIILKTFISLMIISFTISSSLTAKEGMRFIGCIPFWEDASIIDSIDFSQMTHIYYAFLTPHSDGSLFTDLNVPMFEKIVKKAKEHNVKTMIGIGGGAGAAFDPDTAMTALMDDSVALEKFISYTMSVVRKYDIDGVGNDWEPFINPTGKIEKYEHLMEILNDSLAPLGKFVTCDVIAAPWGAGYMSPRSIEISEFINVMTYVFNSNAIAEMDSYMQYWQNSKGVPKEKLNVVVGLFGQPSNNWRINYTYEQIMQLVPNAHEKDSATIDNYLIWYNGPNMCEKIVDLAWNKYAGIAMWHIGLDDFGEHSLYNTMAQRHQDHIDGKVATISKSKKSNSYKNNLLSLNSLGYRCLEPIIKLNVYNSQGKLIIQRNNLRKNDFVSFDSKLPSGNYIVKVNSKGVNQTFKNIIIR